MKAERVTFLIVDDDEVAVMAIERALKRHNLQNPTLRAHDGIEALDMLRNGVDQPFVVLLDINMPRMTGLELMAILRDDETLRDTVTFVLTTSDAPQDIHAAYAHQTAGYILKEDAYRSIGSAIEMLGVYMDNVVLPG